MHICVVSPSYPTKRTIVFVFVDQLCRAFADMGLHVTVIAPQSITRCIVRKEPISKRHYQITTKKGNLVKVYRPYTFSMGNGRFKKISVWMFCKAVKRSFYKLHDKPDVIYGHFWSSISAALPIAMRNKIALFGASGEESVAMYDNYSLKEKGMLSSYIRGLVNVSTNNCEECIKLGLINKEKTQVIPNAVDLSVFKGHNKQKCRELLGIGETDFVVAFLGQFVPRKGTLRLDDALKRLNDDNIKAIFIGSGVENPNYDGIIFKDILNHDRIPTYLSACDVFVLPTENEGCSNAIIEAMACGLPIISTDAAFNYDILDDSNSILVDCHDIDMIANAIRTLQSDKVMQERLSMGALNKAEGLSIDKRAQKILSFIKSKLV